ncbi:pirin family protein [Tanticharoenia sakaeratensis]|uniref:Pirin domain-containing protein n=1 Tax=Tanticharoenia sakaeratensis NBRC 103193 TaxID=1231623 RepID=A0A0D6MIV6_9PROT|nr:pirin family protein [Tanticharoenia sakaeratensis]GAN53562.1 pirin domain-containing protein [Tanticharoenia sakaeratensis NBRC 103193]GBQ17549.1 pirin [Tanticharoenia sakaeratensis NBRC 103193]
MLDIRPFASLGGADHGWLHARHHFSFGSYHDRNRMNWGRLRVWNDDEIAPDTGFPPHPHRDMEIITYVRTGAITHEDSLGHKGRTLAGDVQVMSAGTGIVHSEANAEAEPTTLFQIWLLPDRAGEAPRWDTRPFPKDARNGRFALLASGDPRDAGDPDVLPIRSDARLSGVRLRQGEQVRYELDRDRLAYLVPSVGRVAIEVEGASATLNPRDGAAIAETSFIALRALDDAEIVLVESAPL